MPSLNHRRGLLFIGLLALVSVPRTAPAATPAPAACDTSADQRPPDPACGEALDGRADGGSPSWLAVPRAVLWVPRAASRAVFWPVIEGGEVIEHNHLLDRMTALLTTDDGLVGARPELTYATGFLPTAGLRVFYRRLPAESEIGARFLTAGPAVMLGQLQLRGPDWLGLRLEAAFNRRDDRLFAGIGPSSAADLASQGRGLARYGSDAWMTELRWTRRLRGPLGANLHADLQRHDYQADSVRGGPSLAAYYGLPADQCAAAGLPAGCVDPALVPGFNEGLRIAHGGGGLALDMRRRTRDGSGVAVAVDATYAQGLAGDPSQHATFSGETVLALGGTDRVLLLRGRAAMIEPLGSAAVPFEELITPSGIAGMRGFPEGRFRGESGLVGTAEYRYYIASSLDASLFTDVGTVAGRRFAGLQGDRWFPSFGLGFRVYVPAGPHWEALPRTGVQLAYAPDAGFRLMVTLAGF